MIDDTDPDMFDPEVVTRVNKMLRTLTPAQVAAINALLRGADQETAASAAGVHRVTVNRWVNHHPEFQAALNRGRKELLDQQMDRLRHIDRLALESMARRVEAGDDKASEQWLKMRGLPALDTSKIGPTEGDAIIGMQVDSQIRELRAEDRSMTQDTTFGYDRHVAEEIMEIVIAMRLNECTYEEALSSTRRERLNRLREADGHAEADKNHAPGATTAGSPSTDVA